MKEISFDTPPFTLATIRVVYDSLACRKTGAPMVRFRKKWYHPKWYASMRQDAYIRRYGFAIEPMCYLVNPRATGAGEFYRDPAPYLICHPSLRTLLSIILESEDFEKFTALVNRFQ